MVRRFVLGLAVLVAIALTVGFGMSLLNGSDSTSVAESPAAPTSSAPAQSEGESTPASPEVENTEKPSPSGDCNLQEFEFAVDYEPELKLTSSKLGDCAPEDPEDPGFIWCPGTDTVQVTCKMGVRDVQPDSTHAELYYCLPEGSNTVCRQAFG